MKEDNIALGIVIFIFVVVFSIIGYFCYQDFQVTKKIRQHTREIIEKCNQIEEEYKQRELEYFTEEKEYITIKNLDNIEVVAKIKLPNKETIEFRMSPKVCDYDLITQQIILSKVQIYYLLLDRKRIPENSTVLSLYIEKCKN